MATRRILYLDESGTHDATHCTVAGYIATPLQWAKFGHAWAEILADHGVVPPLHAYELWNRRRQFQGWSAEQEARLLVDLFMPINDLRLNAVAASIEVAPFEALSFGERSLLALHTPKPTRRL